MYTFYPTDGIEVDKTKIIESLQETDEYCWGELVRWSISSSVPSKFQSMMPEKGYSDCEKQAKGSACMCGRFCKEGFFDGNDSDKDEQDFLPF